MRSTNSARQLTPLTSLRFFAAASIVYFHVQSFILGGEADTRFALGVSFFFVLSGFVLAYAHRDSSGRTVGEFYFSRFARIWPLHVVTFILTIALVPTFPLDVQSAGIAAINLSLLQAWLPFNATVFSFNGVSWSISAEAAFYVLLPVLLMTRRFVIWYIGIAALALLIIALLDIENPAAAPEMWGFDPKYMTLQFPPVRCFEFATGVLGGRWFNSRRLDLSKMQGSLLEVATILAVFLYASNSMLVGDFFKNYGLPNFGYWYSQAGGMIFFAAMILVFANGQGMISSALSWRPLVFLGEISFSTYMVHLLVLKLTIRFDVVSWLGKPAAIILALSIIYTLSYVLRALVEVRLRRVLMILFYRKRATVDSSRQIQVTTV